MGERSNEKRRIDAGLSRRELLLRSATYGSALWVAIHLPRASRLAAMELGEEAEPLKRLVLDENQWRAVEAVTARIIPTDDEPGAIEAGCVSFIDRALAAEEASAKPFYVAGVAGLDAVSRRRFERPFVELAPEEQDEMLAALESGDAGGWPNNAPIDPRRFFEMVRVHTIVGYLADPRYGGNRGFSGWKVAGYPGPRHHEGGYTPKQLLGEEKIPAVWDRATTLTEKLGE